MADQEYVLKPIVAHQKSIEELIGNTCEAFLSLRIDSTPYKVLLYVFWYGGTHSPKKISNALKLDIGTVKMAVRQLNKMNLLSNPRRGLYKPNRDRCLAVLLHIHRLSKERLP